MIPKKVKADALRVELLRFARQKALGRSSLHCKPHLSMDGGRWHCVYPGPGKPGEVFGEWATGATAPLAYSNWRHTR
ncbi:hypothetical protein [Burkholderia gladioli]|uniref:hypothetical protein n=1 Tax=Burkholderia gladioli TaxID=28095 RepID=UPI0016412B5D|nr:hypothetical protein [Burkholderia gladioli]